MTKIGEAIKRDYIKPKDLGVMESNDGIVLHAEENVHTITLTSIFSLSLFLI